MLETRWPSLRCFWTTCCPRPAGWMQVASAGRIEVSQAWNCCDWQGGLERCKKCKTWKVRDRASLVEERRSRSKSNAFKTESKWYSERGRLPRSSRDLLSCSGLATTRRFQSRAGSNTFWKSGIDTFEAWKMGGCQGRCRKVFAACTWQFQDWISLRNGCSRFRWSQWSWAMLQDHSGQRSWRSSSETGFLECSVEDY